MSAAVKYGGTLLAAIVLVTNGSWLFGELFAGRAEPPAAYDRNAGSAQQGSLYDVMADLVVPHGYSLEEHFAETDDGYILRLFRLGACGGGAGGPAGQPTRIPQDPNPSQDSSSISSRTDADSNTTTASETAKEQPHLTIRDSLDTVGAAILVPQLRPVVFLHHPLMGSSADWVVMGPSCSLAFILADAGYDVWLTNVRGNRFSRNHTHLSPDTRGDVEAFWSFSWDEHVALDLPAALELVAGVAGLREEGRLLFVGYSQGTTVGLAALASQPRVARRVVAAVLLAPVAFVSHMTSPLFRMMARGRADRLFRLLGLHEYGGHSREGAQLSSSFCAAHPGPCIAYLQLLCGTNPTGNLAPGLLPAIMNFLPSGTSVQNMAHWGQAVRESNPMRLSYYDYGTDCSRTVPNPTARRTGGQYPCNQVAYNSSRPPAYPLHAITTPLALFTGGHDSLADPVDVALLRGALQGRGGAISESGARRVAGTVAIGGCGAGCGGKRGLEAEVVQLHHDEPDYGHLDFGVGQDAAERIYPLVLAFLRQHTPGIMDPAARAA